MPKAKLFMNGRSQAVRLPKEFRFSGTSVTIERHGDGVLLLPEKEEKTGKEERDAWFESWGKFSPDFMENGKEQPMKPEALWKFIDQLAPDITVDDLHRPPPMEPEDLFD